MIQNTTEWYMKRQQELLGLLDETLKLDLDDKPRAELTPIHKKCKENQFEIVLSGEFQGGKSTTFNALCDGRDLSPRGLGGGGVKTSAAIISAQNISDGETRDGMSEWAEITYKSASDIAQQIYDLVRMPLSHDENLKRYLQQKKQLSDEALENLFVDKNIFANNIDLEDATCHQALKSVLHELWKDESIKSEDDTYDQLRIATLFVKFYGSSAHSTLVSKNIFGIYDYQKLVAFPQNWNKKWLENGENANFTFDEISFIFIGRALLRIKSTNLERIGCRITDCPGLFANDYDTRVAMQAIGNADALWYLVDGEKQIGDADLRNLEEIRKLFPDAKKLVISVNLRGKHKQKLERVFPETQATLTRKGFTQKIFPYNAWLAFLAEQGMHIIDNDGLSGYEKKCLCADAEAYDIETDSDDIKEIWSEMVSEVGHTTGLADVKHVDELTTENAQVVLDGSYLGDILSYLHNEMIPSKAKSILIDHGSQRAISALQSYEGTLKAVEETARNDEEQQKKLWDERKAKLEKFVKYAVKKIDESDMMLDKERYAEAMTNELFENFTSDDFCHQYSMIVAESIKKFRFKIYLLAEDYAKDVLQDCKSRLNAITKYAYHATITSWQNGAGKNWNWYQKHLNNLYMEITRDWEDCQEHEDFFKGISLFLYDLDSIRKQLNVMQDNVTSLNIEAIKKFDTSFFGATIGRMWDWVTGKYKGEEQLKEEDKTLISKICKDIEPQLKTVIKTWESNVEVKNGFILAFTKVQEEILNNMVDELDNMLDLYETQQVAPAEAAYKESLASRQMIAKNNHDIRVSQIEPIRKRIQEFEEQVTNELKSLR